MRTPERKRFLLYVQHLTGAGHYVRTFEIARELARHHDVLLVDGGRVVRDAAGAGPLRLSLPRICRSAGEIRPVDEQRDIADVMRRRLERLLAAVDRFTPDVVVTEHFPFSKLELADEILPVLDRARRRNGCVKVVSSVRDVLTRTRRESTEVRHEQRVQELLSRHFDGVVVHADPDFLPLEDHVSWVGQIAPPVHYTGYVSQRMPSGPSRPSLPTCPFVVVSSGGCGGAELLPAAIGAWRDLSGEAPFTTHEMVVFLSPATTDRQRQSLEAQAAGLSLRFRPFSGDFLHYLGSASLSVSHAGYNTCMNLLESNRRAVLVPNRDVSDQLPRARRLAERGLAVVLEPGDLTASRLASLMLEARHLHVPPHRIDLDGAKKTRLILERLCASPATSVSPGFRQRMQDGLENQSSFSGSDPTPLGR